MHLVVIPTNVLPNGLIVSFPTSTPLMMPPHPLHRVRTVLPNGLIVSFLTYFQGTIDLHHAAVPVLGEPLKNHYVAGQKLRARILFVNPAEKRVGLSVLPHLQVGVG